MIQLHIQYKLIVHGIEHIGYTVTLIEITHLHQCFVGEVPHILMTTGRGPLLSSPKHGKFYVLHPSVSIFGGHVAYTIYFLWFVPSLAIETAHQTPLLPHGQDAKASEDANSSQRNCVICSSVFEPPLVVRRLEECITHPTVWGSGQLYYNYRTIPSGNLT